MDQTVICIAGAHRSGTSLLTRLLQHCGLYLGRESEMMPPGQDNPDGFWENLRFVALNDELLSATGAAWDLPPCEGETFQGDQLAAARAKANLLIAHISERPTWGWKDPRNSLTLPFWRTLLPLMKTIIIVRNPLEVAYSMYKRNGTSYALGLRLWEIYNRRALAHTEPGNRLLTSYQAFFDNPERELRAIADFSGLSVANIASAASLVSQIRRHTSFSIEQVIDAGVSNELIQLFEDLVSGRPNEDRASELHNLDSLAGATSKIIRSVPDSEEIREELARRRGDEIHFRENLASHQATIESLRSEVGENNVRAAAELGRRDGRIEELQTAYGHLDQMLSHEQQLREQIAAELSREQQLREQITGKLSREQQLQEQITEELSREQQLREQITEELNNVRDRFDQTNQLLQSLSVRLAAAENRNVSLTDRLRKQLLELKKLLKILDQTSEAAALLRKSRRWKIANPFTALRSLLTGQPVEGFGHLDNNVAKYQAWRKSHPELDSLSDEIQSLRTYEGFTTAGVWSQTNQTEPAAQPGPTAPPDPTAPIEFVRHEEVEVSIIIPVFNQLKYTLSCLAAVQEHSGSLRYEVIVVDDCSNDSTAAELSKIPGLTYLRSETNSGFIATCNRGAAAARGAYLVFLNNDTNVTPGWLTALRDTFRFEPHAGLVGSKLVYPDGRLQEAGGIIWRDGSGWNRGKFKDPHAPEYNYLRSVDYCSAASVMIPAPLFAALGGFDSKYAPAYYEDTDLAFKVAAQGLSVLYQPLSVVTHYEGITSGTDLAAGAKQYQEINRATFVTTWAEVLARKPENGDLAGHERLPPGAKRILVIDHHLPLFDRDSGSLRMSQILAILQGLGHRVTFLPDNLSDLPPYGDELRKRGIEVVYHPYALSVSDYLRTQGPTLTGAIMNSWKSSLFAACAPPLRTLKCGTGIRGVEPVISAIHCQSGRSAACARAREAAMEVATTLFAPSRRYPVVPSSSARAASTCPIADQDRPVSRPAMSVLIRWSAWVMSRPPNAVPPSRSSTASWAPVDAPAGASPVTVRPSSSSSRTRTVG